MGPVRALNLWLSLSRCGDEAPGLDLVPRRLDELVADPDRRGDARRSRSRRRKAEEAAGDTAIVRPIFEPGDALLFDELFLHQTGSDPSMPKPRYAIESWFFGALGVPGRLRAGRALVTRPLPDFDPYSHDPTRWGASLAHSAELMLPCLDAAGARSVVEVGAFAGDLTRVLVAWAEGAGAQVDADRPGAAARPRGARERASRARADPRDEPRGAAADRAARRGRHRRRPQLLHGLRGAAADRRARAGRRAAAAALPRRLLAARPPRRLLRRRRDPGRGAPPARRRAAVASFPGEPGLRPGGLPYPRSAAHEGGPRNGVLHRGRGLRRGPRGPPARRRARSSSASASSGTATRRGPTRCAAILDPFDRHPMLERLEANRVHHLAPSPGRAEPSSGASASGAAARRRCCAGCCESSAFAVAERLSRLRVRAGRRARASPWSRKARSAARSTD